MHVFDHDDAADWFLVKMASVDGLSHHYLHDIESNGPFKLTFEMTWKMFLKSSMQHWSTIKIILSKTKMNKNNKFFKRSWKNVPFSWSESSMLCPCLSREIETIAIFIDIIWATSVKPGLFPAQNQRTDFGRSLLGTCVCRLSPVSPIAKLYFEFVSFSFIFLHNLMQTLLCYYLQ